MRMVSCWASLDKLNHIAGVGGTHSIPSLIFKLYKLKLIIDDFVLSLCIEKLLPFWDYNSTSLIL